MKTEIVVNASALRAAASTLKKIVDARSKIPILTYVMVTPRGESVDLYATDCDVSATLTIDAISDGAPFCVNLNSLWGALKGASGDVELIESDGVATVGAGAVKVTLATLPVADMPTLKMRDEFTAAFDLSGDQFAEIFAANAFAMSNEETRYYLNGVFVHTKKKGEHAPLMLCGAATDGHRLSMTEFAAPHGVGPEFGAIVPALAVKFAAAAYKKAAAVSVAFAVDRVQFRAPGAVITSKLIDGTFPDYSRVVPHGNGRRIEIAPNVLADNLAPLVATHRSRSKAIRLTLNGRLEALQKFAEGDGATFSQELLAHDVDGKPAAHDDSFEIGFNGQYLRDVCAAYKGADFIAAEFGDASSPILISAPERSQRVVVMPLRV